MNLTVNNAQNDGGGLCPHIVRVWQNGTFFAEYVAKPEASGVTNNIYDLPDGTYDIEVINPNITESYINTVVFFYDPANNYTVTELANGRQNITSGHSYIFLGISSSQYPNLTVETFNYGTSNTALYTLVGENSITGGTDLDGNTIPSNKTYFQQIGYKDITTGLNTGLLIANKKNWQTSDGKVDVSSYIPYLPYISQSGGTEGTDLTSPIPNKTAALNTESVVFSGMQAGDVLTLIANDSIDVPFSHASEAIASNAGQVSVGLANLGGLTLKAKYTRNGTVSPFSVNVVVTQDNSNKLPELTYSRVIASNTGAYYVGEEMNVTGISEGASIHIRKSDGTDATLNTDYSLQAITGGYRVKFLAVNYFTISQQKANYTDSTPMLVNVLQTRPVLDVPTPSVNNLIEGGTLTITNQTSAGYSNVNILKNGNIIPLSDGDYTLNTGVYKILKAGTYTFIGQKTGVNDSAESSQVIVTTSATSDPLVTDWEDVQTTEQAAPTTPTPTPTPPTPTPTPDTRIYTIIVRNYCTVNSANIQVGSGNTTNPADVKNWADGLVLQLDIVNNARPYFFIRDKTNINTVSPAYTIP
ncbi:hypothetical protein VB796_06500 [Arcicella sp. LKC2W]|uniref:hypothetical protein n=1 Tax=Arcicella sp. LKC2W TaxID=2984198 RepID=UPI002B1EC7D4|nr:hypothetical protein [Arcicella sp. LKC2W]MEA5458677.1 hypothetical protein [Arcicella sp. LKC2W]